VIVGNFIGSHAWIIAASGLNPLMPAVHSPCSSEFIDILPANNCWDVSKHISLYPLYINTIANVIKRFQIFPPTTWYQG
jgi:hypothetical protein